MKTQGVVIADDPVFVNWLQNGVGSAAEFTLVRAASTEDLVERVSNIGRMDVACFEFSAANQDTRARLVEAFIDRFPDVPVVGMGADGAQDVVLSAMRSGARDFFVLQRDDAYLPNLLSKVLRRSLGSGPRPQHGAQGKVVSVFSAAAYEGTAFAAEHLALRFLERKLDGERGLLLDLSAPPGAASVFLNLHPSYTLLDAVQDVYRCDQTLVDTAFARHGSGLYVLTLPEERIGFPRLEGEELVKLLEVLRTLFGFIVVAMDGHVGSETIADLLALCESSLLITDQSILKSRHSKYLLRELRLHDGALNHTRLVVDNYQRRFGLEGENLAQLLELPLAGTLSGQPLNRVQAMNSGEPLSVIAPKDPYLREIEELADLLWGGSSIGAPEARGGLFARWLGKS
ncbi:hypothetical protein [Algiphilus sp.]|uniref:AAA family ATPase n=1 Tax=Algiphilus sp. TaxID=1872431 RepID=UPI001CA6DB0F|nr:hypothetical protein [Algiphilus sp.]MBY8965510.1 hypothetical protein [Algiphilus acroporae]MCI5061837.1 hypothetical protein [Algiphilus sp.]MCI5102431.1 hypothetical protein [Algiphilus sp.]MCR9089915.1 hypothetical protein [Pseudomonadota bacterium]